MRCDPCDAVNSQGSEQAVDVRGLGTLLSFSIHSFLVTGVLSHACLGTCVSNSALSTPGRRAPARWRGVEPVEKRKVALAAAKSSTNVQLQATALSTARSLTLSSGGLRTNQRYLEKCDLQLPSTFFRKWQFAVSPPSFSSTRQKLRTVRGCAHCLCPELLARFRLHYPWPGPEC